ncbi:ATP-binding response regulator [Sphingorhabdus sp.]|uniref:ATP-binding response regulator n=4 Tax=Sphingorhabdus sp. TaxID=1902408 RepID=UPI003C76C464|nr:hybrid sensor histidine kinase/response regulator [Sphingomonadales bacterium]
MAQDTAQAALQSKSRFLAQASHDLRQPIHSVGFYLDILRTTGTEIERNQLIDRIERAIGSVSRLFKSLLDISRVDSGTIEVVAETIALDAMLADIVQQNEQHAYWNNVELRYLPTRFKVRADPTLLATMVQNLVSNAIKYSHGAKVLVGARRKGDSIAIEIYDQGIGIDANHLPHIFEEFYRAHEAGDRDAEGVGLGLAIVARLALLSGFEVTVNSQRNKGTMARISGIPVSARQIASAPVIDGWIAKPLDKFRVILIEDDQDVLDATRTLLGLWGCDVQSYAEMPIHVRPADVIVADFDLGDGQLGTDAIRTIRSQHGEAIPAILMTGHSGPQIEQHIDRLDVQILSKPVQPATLRSVLSSIRSRSRG